MSKDMRNKLSAAAWGGAVFCALWLLVSAQAAVSHFNAYQAKDSTEQTPTRTVKVLVPDNVN